MFTNQIEKDIIPRLQVQIIIPGCLQQYSFPGNAPNVHGPYADYLNKTHLTDNVTPYGTGVNGINQENTTKSQALNGELIWKGKAESIEVGVTELRVG